MADAYSGRNSRRSNAPCGHFRAELVRITKANEIILSGSPIEYFCHPDYQNGNDHTAQIFKMGIEGIYSHTDTAWLNPNVVVSSVSTDGYTITLSSGADEGDLVEVYYYATAVGAMDHQTAGQIGDPLTTETLDAAVQKLNDCPSLDFEEGGCLFDQELCSSAVDPATGATTTTAKYAAVQVGTWQTTNLPFYVTSVFLAWDGATVNPGRTGTMIDVVGLKPHITVDGGSEREWFTGDLIVMSPTGGGGTNFDQFMFIDLGLVEVESDFEVEMELPAGFNPTSFRTTISGYYIP
jgi:hypothetical protein